METNSIWRKRIGSFPVFGALLRSNRGLNHEPENHDDLDPATNRDPRPHEPDPT